MILIVCLLYDQRIQYAKTKSDCLAKEDGTFVPRDKRKKQEEKGRLLFLKSNRNFTTVCFDLQLISPMVLEFDSIDCAVAVFISVIRFPINAAFLR